MLRNDCEIHIFKTHLEQHSAPSKLDFGNYPIPLLQHDQPYIDGYNDLIKKFQIEILEYQISYIDNRRNTYLSEINQI